ncbi:HNH endonuclease signature motif containing protein [Rhodococcus sp. MEB041]|uniref:HNH endonuclease signature motif containing protein n=1 Tax=Rhodococcus sp. MEB041 TaxID=3040323 RepID=UPI002551194F|nr:HNH endonuclease signature motif containing protein [Rhodococcus sp. MEB041]
MYDAEASVDVVVSAKVDAQASFARTVSASCAYVQESSRRPAVLGPGGVFDAEAAETCAVAEVAAALAVSTRTVSEWLFLTRTAHRAVAEAFDAGLLAYAAFRTVCRSVAGVPNATEALLQRVIAAASRCTPGAVAAAVDRILAEFDAEWHRIARERATTERYVSVRKLPRGQAELKVRGPAEQIAGMKRAIVEAARGVCDPSSLPARLFDAAHAIITGTPLPCDCVDESCAHAPSPAAPAHHAVIVLDAATAAGLAGEPGHLVGWGPVPADTARRIAGDATWQAMITAAEVAEPRAGCSCRCPQHDPPTDSEPPGPPVPAAGREVRRTPRMPAGWTPTTGKLGSTKNRKLREQVDYLRTLPPSAVDRAVADPDGHGGFAVPPAGALTYRPSEAIASLVTALYPTCIHPGCAVPSEDCDLDHVVPFDHTDHPERGGWTVTGNLAPLCRRHHGLKTRRQWHHRMLRDGIVHVRDSHGTDYLTAPGE